MCSPPWALVALWAGMAADDAQASRPPDPSPYLAVVRISEELLRPMTSRDVHRRTPVRQTVLGTLATGSALTRGQVALDLHAAQHPFCFSVVFQGSTYARTVGRKGPAVIHSDATTGFTAVKTINFDYARGFHASPPRISAKTNTRTLSVRSTVGGVAGCLVQRAAWRRIRANQATLNATASRNARQRIASSFDSEVARAVARLNADFALLKPALAPYFEQQQEPVITFWTDDDYLKIAVARPQQEYKRPVLPDEVLEPSLLQIWLHETLLRNESAPPPVELAAFESALTQLRKTYGTVGVRFYLPRGTPGLVALTDRWIVIGLGDPLELAGN